MKPARPFSRLYPNQTRGAFPGPGGGNEDGPFVGAASRPRWSAKCASSRTRGGIPVTVGLLAQMFKLFGIPKGWDA
jgi:hypothetical protein